MSTAFVLVIIGIFVLAGVVGSYVGRQTFYGEWRERFRCKHCKHIDQYAWAVCPHCGEAMSPRHIYTGGGDWESVTARASGLSGWEVKPTPKSIT